MALIKRSKEVLVENFPDSKVIFSLETYIPYILNRTAAEIWGFLKRPRTKKEAVDFLGKRYNLIGSVAKKDVERFLAAMQQKGVIQIAKEKKR
jgi:hypothetical protein